MVDWIKNNKLLTVLILFITFFGFQFYSASFVRKSSPMSQYSGATESFDASDSFSMGMSGSAAKIGLQMLPPSSDYTPEAGVSNRLVVQDSNLSLLVEDVVDTRNNILSYTTSNGGYMVNASTNNPQDAPTGALVLRIPANKLQASLDYFHSLSIKVVSENLVGTDVTDQYIDIEARIARLERSMSRLEDILNQATKVEDITNLTQQILYYQEQIDSLKGQQDSLEKNAELSKITIYLSTDEIALPYAPSETFRPQVIFKLAVRSLVSSLRDIAGFTIWIGVYAAIWIPLLLTYLYLRRWWKKKNAQQK